jgi:hypothetical protein
VALYKHLSEEKKEFVLSKFVLASGTQIGARIFQFSIFFGGRLSEKTFPEEKLRIEN